MAARLGPLGRAVLLIAGLSLLGSGGILAVLGATMPAAAPAPRAGLRALPTPEVLTMAPTPPPVSYPPQPVASVSPTPTTVEPVTTGEEVYYATCAAAKQAGAAPLHRGDPGYRAKLDRDGDGVACES
jgi:hypothetical protein